MVDLLIITSCVNPVKQDLLQFTNRFERYRQTIDSILFYIRSGACRKICICDGSNIDLTEDDIINEAKINNIKIEFLHFKQNLENVKTYGKGYGEGEIMQYIVDNSVLINECTSFVKITGRLVVSNINKILTNSIIEDGIYFNIIPSKKLGCVDTRFYIIPLNIYISYFLEAYKSVNDYIGNTYESVFTDVIQNNKLKIHFLPYVPIIRGKSGTTNQDYSKDIEYYIKVILTKLGIMNTRFAAFCLLFYKILSRIIVKLK